MSKWATLFKAGQERIKDDLYPVCPSTDINKINTMVMKDCHSSVQCIAAHLNVSVGSVKTKATSCEMMILFEENLEDFLIRTVT